MHEKSSPPPASGEKQKSEIKPSLSFFRDLFTRDVHGFAGGLV
jgi:hypothetical protein